MISNSSPPGFRRRLALLFADSFIVVGWLVWAQWVYYGGFPEGDERLLPAMMLACQLLVFQVVGVYQFVNIHSLLLSVARALLALCGVILLFLGAAYVFKVSDKFPRLVMGPWVLGSALSLVLCRFALLEYVRDQYRRGREGKRVLLLGAEEHVAHVAATFHAHPEFGVRIVGWVCTQEEAQMGVCNVQHLGSISDLSAIVHREEVDGILVCAGLADDNLIKAVFSKLKTQPVQVYLAPDMASFGLFRAQIVDYGGQALINVTGTSLKGMSVVLKWFEDKVLGLFALLLFAIPMVACAVLVKLTSPGPVFFIQERHGLGGRPIRVYKFRSMRTADKGPVKRTKSDRLSRASGFPSSAIDDFEHGDSDSSSGSAESKVGDSGSDDFKQATANDPRITWVGNILRKTSLDELPQILNVLGGSMSLVGPRPHPIKLNQEHSDVVENLMHRHYVKPGITGWAQVNGSRGETKTVADMQRRINYDLEYIRNWSLWLDLRILFLTVFKGFINRQP